MKPRRALRPAAPTAGGGRRTLTSRLLVSCAVAAALWSAACSTAPPPGPPTPSPLPAADSTAAAAPAPAAGEAAVAAAADTSAPQVESPLLQEGMCSWYGGRFRGRKTSSGEPFDDRRMTAAHRTLPFGTIVSVTDLDSGRGVEVRINDRGPYAGDRIIDLSKSAAEALGILGKGIAHVQIQVLSDDLSRWPTEVYAVQVGAFKFRSRADRISGELSAMTEGNETCYVRDPDALSRFYRVRIGTFENKEQALAAAARLRAEGISTLLVRESYRLHAAMASRRGASQQAATEIETVSLAGAGSEMADAADHSAGVHEASSQPR